jgi:hypothetical protein
MEGEYRNLLGYLPQDFGFYPEFTVQDYLLYIATIKGIRPVVARKRTKELIKKVGLTKVANKKMKKLSDIKNSVHKEFGLSRDSREKVTTLVGLLLEFHDIEMSEFYTNMKSNEADEDGKKREKFVVKFRRVGEEEYKYFITAGVLAERIMEYKSSMPFEATIEERGRGKKRYMVIV